MNRAAAKMSLPGQIYGCAKADDKCLPKTRKMAGYPFDDRWPEYEGLFTDGQHVEITSGPERPAALQDR
jgi:hypothetical protein